MQLTKLSQEGVGLLTSVYHFREGEDAIQYANHILAQIKALPEPMQRNSRLSLLFRGNPPQIQLCALHKHLNADLANGLFNLIVLEAGGRLNSLCVNINLLPEVQQARIRRVRGVHQLWLGEVDFCRTFPTATPSQKWRYQEDRCKACATARMAGDLEFLMDMYIIVNSRHEKEPPSVIRFLASFLNDHLASMSQSDKIHIGIEVESETAELKQWRRKLHKLRKEEGLKKGATLVQTLPEESATHTSLSRTPSTLINSESDLEAKPHDAVLSIVNLYDHLRSSQHLPPEEMQAFNIANAFHSGLGSDTAPSLPQQGLGHEPSERRSTIPGIPTVLHQSEPETILAPTAYTPPRQDWTSSSVRGKKPEREHRSYLAKDSRISQKEFMNFKGGETTTPFSSSRQSLRGSRATLLDRKGAYANLVGKTSSPSINSEALARPKEAQTREIHQSVWDDASLPPTPKTAHMPIPLRPKPSSIYSIASVAPSTMKPASPPSPSELGFEQYLKQHPQPPARARAISIAASSVYSQQATLPHTVRRNAPETQSVKPPVPRIPSAHRVSRSHTTKEQLLYQISSPIQPIPSKSSKIESRLVSRHVSGKPSESYEQATPRAESTVNASIASWSKDGRTETARTSRVRRVTGKEVLAPSTTHQSESST